MKNTSPDPTHESSVWLRTRASLLERLKGESNDADWQQFYNMYWRVVYGYAMRFGLDQTDAKDVVQEVFITVLRRLPSFEYSRSRGRFLSWMKTVTRHKVIDTYRRRQARIEGGMQLEPLDEKSDAIDRASAEYEHTQPDHWETEWQNAALALALERVKDRVDPTTYEAFHMSAIEHRSPEAVVHATGLSSVNAVYQVRKRMIQYLREEVRVIAKQL